MYLCHRINQMLPGTALTLFKKVRVAYLFSSALVRGWGHIPIKTKCYCFRFLFSAFSQCSINNPHPNIHSIHPGTHPLLLSSTHYHPNSNSNFNNHIRDTPSKVAPRNLPQFSHPLLTSNHNRVLVRSPHLNNEQAMKVEDAENIHRKRDLFWFQ